MTNFDYNRILNRYLIDEIKDHFYTVVRPYLRSQNLREISKIICLKYHNKCVLDNHDRLQTTKMFLKIFKKDKDISYIVSDVYIPIRDKLYINMKIIVDKYEAELKAKNIC
jgi:hypothetical protein